MAGIPHSVPPQSMPIADDDVTGFKAEQEHISGSTMSVPQVAKKFKANITCYSRTTEKVSEA